VLSVARDHADARLDRIEQALIRAGGLRAVVTRRHDPGHRGHFHISAKMTLDDASPDTTIDAAGLLARLRGGTRAQLAGASSKGSSRRR
jgi:hypothetical protein